GHVAKSEINGSARANHNGSLVAIIGQSHRKLEGRHLGQLGSSYIVSIRSGRGNRDGHIIHSYLCQVSFGLILVPIQVNVVFSGARASLVVDGNGLLSIVSSYRNSWDSLQSGIST